MDRTEQKGGLVVCERAGTKALSGCNHALRRFAWLGVTSQTQNLEDNAVLAEFGNHVEQIVPDLLNH